MFPSPKVLAPVFGALGLLAASACSTSPEAGAAAARVDASAFAIDATAADGAPPVEDAAPPPPPDAAPPLDAPAEADTAPPPSACDAGCPQLVVAGETGASELIAVTWMGNLDQLFWVLPAGSQFGLRTTARDSGPASTVAKPSDVPMEPQAAIESLVGVSAISNQIKLAWVGGGKGYVGQLTNPITAHGATLQGDATIVGAELRGIYFASPTSPTINYVATDSSQGFLLDNTVSVSVIAGDPALGGITWIGPSTLSSGANVEVTADMGQISVSAPYKGSLPSTIAGGYAVYGVVGGSVVEIDNGPENGTVLGPGSIIAMGSNQGVVAVVDGNLIRVFSAASRLQTNTFPVTGSVSSLAVTEYAIYWLTNEGSIYLVPFPLP